MKAYDSAYSVIDDETRDVITILFGTSSYEIVPVGEQEGVALCHCYINNPSFTVDPATIRLDQAEMRSHLIKCIEYDCFSLFPIIAQH